MSHPLTQAEADRLIRVPKYRVDTEKYEFPHLGGDLRIPLIGYNRETFVLDVSRSLINLSKNKYQNRVRQAIPLVRLDIGGPPHRNPDGVEIPCPHLHVYREGWDLKWAYRIEDVSDAFHDPTDTWQLLQDFIAYVNIVDPPVILRGLFT